MPSQLLLLFCPERDGRIDANPKAIPHLTGTSPYRRIRLVTRAGEAPIAMQME
jgi:hypothetical protein